MATMRGCHDRGRGGSDEKGESTKVRSVHHDGMGWDGMGWDGMVRPAIPVG